jgi:RHS repeat-associated protein
MRGGVTTLSSILAAAASLALFLANTTTAYATTLHHLWNQTFLTAALLPPSGGGGTNSGIGIGDDEPLPNETNTGNPYRWQAQVADTNTLHGNKLTTVPLVGWEARGGMPVQFTLYHNSKATINRELGQKWSHTYLLYLLVDSQTGNVTVHWGDDKCYTFIRQPNGSYLPPAGIYDNLVANGSPISSYDLTTKEQIRYRFTNPNGTGWFCTSITDPNGNTITLTYNSSNRLTRLTDPTNRRLNFSYNVSGRMTAVTDPLNRQWTFTYDAYGRLTQVNFPTLNGNTYRLQFGYNNGNNIISLTDRRGNVWQYSYDASNRLVSQTDPAGNTITFSYGSNQTTVTDPNGHTTVHTYDGNGRLLSEQDALGYIQSYSWDTNNNLTALTDRRGNVWSFTYDNRGNVLSQTDPLGNTSSFTYNTRNRVLTVTDPLGHQTVNTYDATGWNLIQTQHKDSNGTVISTVGYAVNSYGLVTSKTDANGHTTQYGYDTHGNLTSVTTPLGKVTQYSYNLLGLQTARTDAMGRTTTYSRDNWMRLVQITYPDNSVKTFSYDANDNLVGWTDSTGTWSRTYDAANRLTSESWNGVVQVSYGYDATGKRGLLSSMSDLSGRTVTYSYTARNELASVTEPTGTTSYTYDTNGNEVSITAPNGVTTSKTYDAANRLTSIVHRRSDNSVIASYNYSYNADGLRTQVVEADGSTVTYTYDGAHRLVGEVRTGTAPYSISYTLDGEGNRLSQTVNGVTTTFSYNADDQLLSTSGGFNNSYTYNANGEQVSRVLNGVSYTLSWDYDGQLVGISGNGSTVTFGYDALGRRVSRTANGTTCQLVHDGDRIIVERQGGAVTAVYSYGNALVARNGEVVLSDGLGTTRATVNGVQAITSTLTTEAFGNAVAQWGSTGNPYRFAGAWGYRDDGDAGLLHVGARYYDPQVGRFVSRDAVLSEHPYLYCEHEPVNSVDPSGNIPQWVKDYAKAAWEWTKEHASDIGKGIGIVVGTLVGIKLAEELYVVYVDWDCSNRMRRMMREWGQIPEEPIAEYMDNLFRSHIRDAMCDSARLAGDAAKQIYGTRPK